MTRLITLLLTILLVSNLAKADIGISGAISYTNHNYTVVRPDSMPGAGATMHVSVTVQNFSPSIPANSVYFYFRLPNSQFLKPDSIISVPTGWQLTDSSNVGNETILRFTNTSVIADLQTSVFVVRVMAESESSGAFNAVMAQMQYIGGAGSGWVIFATSLTGLIETAEVGDEPLPVELYDFTAKALSQSVLLNWSTSSEKNNYGFYVEKSTDGKDWKEVGFVASKAKEGMSNINLNYDLTDFSPMEGINLYRLRQEDFDGSIAYSLVRKVDFKYHDLHSEIFPNPAKGVVTIIAQDIQNIQITDIHGKIMNFETLSHSDKNVSIGISSIPNGVYSIQIVSPTKSFHQKLMVVK